MATTSSTFRRPKGKGGTKTSLGVDDGARGMRKYHRLSDPRNDYRTLGQHKGGVEVGTKRVKFIFTECFTWLNY